VTASIVHVGELTTYLRDLVEQDESLQDIWVEGEVSAYTVPASGHAYFSIKDDASAIDCVMWKMIRQRQSFRPSPGDQVIVHGSISVYERNSRLQIKADVIHPAGAGLLQLQLEQLRQRLDAEGLFDPSRKRPLPLFPERIGVVTSATGAVWHDIQRVLGRRFPLAALVLAPATVQGDLAPESVTSALQALQQHDIDVIILARGGGSVEDLWAFNDERIARAIFGSRVPVVSAIGHETDVTIADLVADVRASTPSVAAELVSPDVADLSLLIEDFRDRAHDAVTATVESGSGTLDVLTHRLARVSPVWQLGVMQKPLDAARLRVEQAVQRTIDRKSGDMNRIVAALETLNPSAVMGRGFAFVSDQETGLPIRSISNVRIGATIEASLVDGSLSATITSRSEQRAR